MSSSGALGSLVIELGASLATLQNDFARAQSITDRAINDINVTINKIGSGANFNGVSTQIQGLTNDFNTLKGVIATVAGVGLGVGSLNQIQEMADAYQGVTNRIITTVSSTEQLAAVQQQLFTVAQATGASLDDTAKTYQRLEQVIEGTGASQIAAQTQAVALTKVLNEEIVVSGSSAAEASRAIMDLVHGLAGGELQTRQLNQIMRQMPDLAKQIAAGLNVSVQELEHMAKKGIDAASVLNALQSQAGKIDERFQQLPLTFARSWQMLSNAVEQYIGKASQASALSDAIKAGIQGLANNIGAVAAAAELAGAAMAIWLGGKALSSVGAMASSLYDAALAQGAYKTATIVSTEADLANAAAMAASVTASREKVVALETIKLAELDEAQAARASLAASIAQMEAYAASAPVGIRYVGTIEAIEAAKLKMVLADKAVLDAENALTGVEARVTIATEAEAAATAQLATAKVALAGAQAEATGAVALFSRAGAGVFAMLGGWTTVIVGVVAGLAYLATRTTEVDDAIASLDKQTAELNAHIPSLTQAFLQLAAGEAVHKQSLMEVTQAHLAEAEAAMKAAETAKGSSADYAQAADAVQYYTKQLADLQDAAAGLSLAHLRQEVVSVISVFQGALQAAQNWRQGLATIVGANAADLEKEAAQLQKHADSIGKTKVQIEQAALAQDTLKDALKAGIAVLDQNGAAVVKNASAYKDLVQAEKDKYAAVMKAAAADDAATAAQKAKTAAMSEARKELTAQQEAYKNYLADLNKVSELEEQLSTALGGPYVQALKTYQKGIDEISKTWSDAVKAGTANEDLWNRLTNVGAQLENRLDLMNASIRAQHDLFLQNAQEMEILNSLWGVAPQYVEATRAAAEAYNNAIRTMTDLHGKAYTSLEDLKKELATQVPEYQAQKQAINDVSEEQKKAIAVQQQWVSIASSGFDSVGNSIAQFATGGIKTWHDFGQSLIGDAKQFIAAIIEEFLKLAVFNGIINSLFGLTGSSALATLDSLAGGASGGAAGGGGLSSIVSGGGLLSKLFGGGGGSAFAGSSASGSVSGGSSAFAGSTASAGYGGFGSSFGYGSGLSSALGAAGALFAGYNEFKAAGGGIGGVAGGAAYGIGTFALGGAISAGVSAAAAGGISAGLTAGFAAIPVVGWIALAAMAVNIISGGKLFGTAAKPYGAEENLSIGASGASISAAIDEKGQKAFFGGTYYKKVSTPVDQATQDSVAAFYDALSKAAVQEAAAFGQTTATIVTGSFHETFDKAGKMLTQTSTVLGKTFTESIQDFQTRIEADTLLANMGAASAEAQQIAEKWQATATDLLAGAQFLAQAESDITQGHALAAGDSLTQLVNVVTSLQQSGESLIQTYARLSAEETDLSNSLALLGLNTGKTGEDFLKFADTLATAAGGLQNLDSLWSNYYSEFYSQQEKQANTLKALQNSVTGSFAAIGEDTGVSMAQFRKDFEAAMPTLTPQQVIQWLVAGDALAKLDAALDQTATTTTAATQAATQQYNDFIDSFTATLNPLDAFQKSIVDLGTTLQQNIDKANQLAQAAGMSGASIDDLTSILQASAVAGAQALAQEEAAAQQLVAKLFGTSIDQLNTQLKAAQDKYATDHANSTLDYMFGAQDQQNIDAIQKQIDAANAQAQAAQNLQDGTALLKDLGDIGAVSGESLQSFSDRMGIPLDKLAGYLNTDQAGLEKLYMQYESAALSQLEIAGNTKYTNELLADILAAYQNKPLPYTGNDPSILSITTKRGEPGQVNSLSAPADQPLTQSQGMAIIAHLDRISRHTGDTSGNTGALVRKSGEILPFNRGRMIPA